MRLHQISTSLWKLQERAGIPQEVFWHVYLYEVMTSKDQPSSVRQTNPRASSAKNSKAIQNEPMHELCHTVYGVRFIFFLNVTCLLQQNILSPICFNKIFFHMSTSTDILQTVPGHQDICSSVSVRKTFTFICFNKTSYNIT